MTDRHKRCNKEQVCGNCNRSSVDSINSNNEPQLVCNYTNRNKQVQPSNRCDLSPSRFRSKCANANKPYKKKTNSHTKKSKETPNKRSKGRTCSTNPPSH